MDITTGTQPLSSEFSIQFALSHHQQSFRFFELPDELVDLVASGCNPRYTQISMKYAELDMLIAGYTSNPQTNRLPSMAVRS